MLVKRATVRAARCVSLSRQTYLADKSLTLSSKNVSNLGIPCPHASSLCLLVLPLSNKTLHDRKQLPSQACSSVCTLRLCQTKRHTYTRQCMRLYLWHCATRKIALLAPDQCMAGMNLSMHHVQAPQLRLLATAQKQCLSARCHQSCSKRHTSGRQRCRPTRLLSFMQAWCNHEPFICCKKTGSLVLHKKVISYCGNCTVWSVYH